MQMVRVCWPTAAADDFTSRNPEWKAGFRVLCLSGRVDQRGEDKHPKEKLGGSPAGYNRNAGVVPGSKNIRIAKLLQRQRAFSQPTLVIVRIRRMPSLLMTPVSLLTELLWESGHRIVSQGWRTNYHVKWNPSPLALLGVFALH